VRRFVVVILVKKKKKVIQVTHPRGETRALAFREFARLGPDLNQSALAESLGVSRARVNALHKIWKGIEAKRLYSADSAAAPTVDVGNDLHMRTNTDPAERVADEQDSRALDASTVDSIIDEAIVVGLDLALLPPLKARQLIAAAESCRRGSPPVLALMGAGVARTTAYEWLKDPAIRAFFDAQDGRFVGVATSRAYEIIMSGPASVAMSGIQFVLERRFPDSFGKKERVDFHAQLESEISISAVLSSPETIELASRLEAFWQQNEDVAGQLPAGIEFRDGAFRQLPAASEDE
jgi:hypothetical protein